MIFHMYYAGVLQLHDLNHQFSQFNLKLTLCCSRIFSENTSKSNGAFNSIIGCNLEHNERVY